MQRLNRSSYNNSSHNNNDDDSISNNNSTGMETACSGRCASLALKVTVSAGGRVGPVL